MNQLKKRKEYLKSLIALGIPPKVVDSIVNAKYEGEIQGIELAEKEIVKMIDEMLNTEFYVLARHSLKKLRKQVIK